MIAEISQAGLVNWVLTYLLHSTILLTAVLLVTRLLSDRFDAIKESLWRLGLIGAIFSATAQVSFQAPSYFDDLVLSNDLALESTTSGSGNGIVFPRRPDDSPAGGVYLDEPVGIHDASPIVGDRTATPADDDPRNASFDSWLRFFVIPSGISTRLLPVAPWVLLLLIGGSILVIAISLVRLRRAMSGRVPIDDARLAGIFDMLRRRAGVRRRIRLTVSMRLTSPVAMGIIRPEICLPRLAVESMADAELESMMAHELAHIVRLDPAWMLLNQTLTTIFFFQPLNFIARNRLRELAEYQCDAWAAAQCENSLSLARCLTEVASWFVQARQDRIDTLLPGMSVQRSSLSRRVDRLLEDDHAIEDSQNQKAVMSALVPVLLGVIALTPGVKAFAGGGAETKSVPPISVPEFVNEPDARPTEFVGETPPQRFEESLDPLADLDHELAMLEKEVAELKQAIRGTDLEAELGGLIEEFEKKVAAIRVRQNILRAENELHSPNTPETVRVR